MPPTKTFPPWQTNVAKMKLYFYWNETLSSTQISHIANYGHCKIMQNNHCHSKLWIWKIENEIPSKMNINCVTYNNSEKGTLILWRMHTKFKSQCLIKVSFENVKMLKQIQKIWRNSSRQIIFFREIGAFLKEMKIV